MDDELFEDDELLADIRHAQEKSRKYASHFEWPDQRIEERGVVQSFIDSAAGEPGYPWSEVRSCDRDPPDCTAVDAYGRLVGFEVTELVDDAAIRRARGNPDARRAEWGRDKLVAKLGAILRRKDPRGRIRDDLAEHLLLIHTDEFELSYDRVTSLLDGAQFEIPTGISRAYLLMSYEPGRDYPFVQLQRRAASPA